MSDRVVRVAVHEAWDEIEMKVDSGTPVGEVKRRALETARVAGDAAEFEVKFRGATVRDETGSVAAAGIPDNGALIVLRRNRRPVR